MVNRTINYTYDGMYRLTGAEYIENAQTVRSYDYTYDLNGNRLSETVFDGLATTTTNYTYNLANQIVTQQLGTGPLRQFTYDPAGNLINDGLNTYSYDAADRLIRIVAGETGFVNTYSYNGLGDRYRQTNNGLPTQYLLDLNSSLTQVLGEFKPGDETYYLLGLDVIGQQRNGEWDYFGYDGLGSMRLMTDAAGLLTYATSYAPYGTPFERFSIPNTSLGFTGEFSDPTGLLYLRARYMSPELGMFLSKDPFGGVASMAMSQNGYSYVHGNPVNYTDPSGKFVLLALAAIGAGALIGWGIGAVAGFALEYLRQAVSLLQQCGNNADFSDLDWSRLYQAAMHGGDVGASIGAEIGLSMAGGIAASSIIRAMRLTGWGARMVTAGADVAWGVVVDSARGISPSDSLLANIGGTVLGNYLEAAWRGLDGVDNALYGLYHSLNELDFSSNYRYFRVPPGSYYDLEALAIRERYQLDTFRHGRVSYETKNVGIADYVLDNMRSDDLGIDPAFRSSRVHSVSGGSRVDSVLSEVFGYDGVTYTPSEQQVFEYLQSGNRGYNRNGAVDSEARILEWFAQRSTDQTSGTIVLYTQLEPCQSCGGPNSINPLGVFGQFMERYPNINLIVLYTLAKQR